MIRAVLFLKIGLILNIKKLQKICPWKYLQDHIDFILVKMSKSELSSIQNIIYKSLGASNLHTIKNLWLTIFSLETRCHSTDDFDVSIWFSSQIFLFYTHTYTWDNNIKFSKWHTRHPQTKRRVFESLLIIYNPQKWDIFKHKKQQLLWY